MTRHQPLVLTTLASVLAVAGCVGPQQGGGPQPVAGARFTGPVRAVWVPRGQFRTVADIERIMSDCASAGLNTVVFQVRGNGTVLYPSKIEPWAKEIGGKDPGFDPLAVAIREAHARNLDLQAWANVMPGWQGPAKPSDPAQLYNAHPDWFWYDQKGERQPLTYMNNGRSTGWYTSVNPCLPEVRAYLVSVFEEIVRNYDIDALHLDYIRFPNETAPRGVDYPHDARTLALYRKATGKAPADDKVAWTEWRTEQVSAVVRDTRAMIDRTRKGCRLTASVGPDPARAKAAHFQDGATWANHGWVNTLFPMDYTDDDALFAERRAKWHAAAPHTPLVIGVGIFMHRETEQSVRQLEMTDQWGQGFCIFSYSALVGGRPPRLEALRPTLLRMANRPS